MERCLYPQERRTVLGYYFALHDLFYSYTVEDFSVLLFDLLEEDESLFGTQSWNELKLVLDVIIFADLIHIKAYQIDGLNNNSLEAIS